MSRGPGNIEQRIADLFAETRDRPLSVDAIASHAFATGRKPPTRAQRLSATRAAHRVLRRVREMEAQADALVAKAHANVKAALGRETRLAGTQSEGDDDEYQRHLDGDPALIAGMKLYDDARRIGTWGRHMRSERRGWIRMEVDFWCATTIKKRLWFHPPDVPVQVWAVTIDRRGVHWFETEITRITRGNVMVRYRGATARLNRRGLWYWWAFWRRVQFVSSCTGRIAAALDEVWSERFAAAGAPPPAMQMPLETARLLLGLGADYTRDDVITAFRRKAKEAHPDVGGTAEMFRTLVEARDRLLTALGTSAPPPPPPNYAPKGVHVVYRVQRSAQGRLGSGTRRLT
jgi:hypothetical protein